MRHLDERTMANLEVTLEDACRHFPNGGDHTLRKQVARKLLASAKRGKANLAFLSRIARDAAAAAAKRHPLAHVHARRWKTD